MNKEIKTSGSCHVHGVFFFCVMFAHKVDLCKSCKSSDGSRSSMNSSRSVGICGMIPIKLKEMYK
jgi:hypothetical protein